MSRYCSLFTLLMFKKNFVENSDNPLSIYMFQNTLKTQKKIMLSSSKFIPYGKICLSSKF